MRLAYIVLLLLLFITLQGQSQMNLPEVIPTSTRLLKSDSDPTQYCIKNIFIDQQGRMWFSTCGVAQEVYSLNLVQFDGYSIRPLRIARDGWEGRIKSVLEGQSSQKEFYGFLNRYPDQSTLYSYNLEENKVNYTPITSLAGGIIEESPGQFGYY